MSPPAKPRAPVVVPPAKTPRIKADDGTPPDSPALATVTVGELIGIAEIAELAGVKRDTVDLWRVRDQRGRVAATPMPRPLLPRRGDLTRTPLYVKSEILGWLNATGRMKAGQPVRSVTPSA